VKLLALGIGAAFAAFGLTFRGPRARFWDRMTATGLVLGGLALAAPEAIRILDAAGAAYILVETVGVGQSEVEVMHAADSTVVVVTPRWGDGIQAGKAGLLAHDILLQVQDKKVPSDPSAFRKTLATFKAGETIAVVITTSAI